mmetsp:Transcript_54974/g.96202  ORF Transcript_54974/g.96202 Transcript_54974/m.96202 type:complete len:215 (-) Transcript_54974:2781-3425(-)
MFSTNPSALLLLSSASLLLSSHDTPAPSCSSPSASELPDSSPLSSPSSLSPSSSEPLPSSSPLLSSSSTSSSSESLPETSSPSSSSIPSLVLFDGATLRTTTKYGEPAGVPTASCKLSESPSLLPLPLNSWLSCEWDSLSEEAVTLLSLDEEAEDEESPWELCTARCCRPCNRCNSCTPLCRLCRRVLCALFARIGRECATRTGASSRSKVSPS